MVMPDTSDDLNSKRYWLLTRTDSNPRRDEINMMQFAEKYTVPLTQYLLSCGSATRDAIRDAP